MAYIRKRGKSWQAQVSWYDLNNERRYKTKSGFATKRQAQKWANEMEVAKSDNQIVDKDPIFAQEYSDYVNTYKIQGKAKTTERRYLYSVKVIENYFGKVKLSKVTRHMYQSFINEYGKDHSKNTMRLINRYIKAFARDCMADKLITTNFTDRINLTWNDENTHKVQYLNYDEIKKLLDSLEDGIKPSYISRYMIITALYTGMRIGEIMALEWSDIDFDNHLIKITKSYSYTEDKIKDPKTETSKRVIRVSKKLLDILKQLRVNHQKFVFMSVTGNIPTTSAANKTLKKQLKKLKIKKDHFHFHSLRHTHVALLLFKGVPLYSISKRLGHANMSITAEVYAYMLDELRQKADDQIETILDGI